MSACEVTSHLTKMAFPEPYFSLSSFIVSSPASLL